MDPQLLELRETVAKPEGPVREDGTVQLRIIRPGVGRGRGKHLYEADMLQRDAGVFKGWRMFIDHQSPEAKKAQGGLPRSVRDLGGIVKEAWWDPNVPGDERHGQGAVMGIVKPTRLVRSLIEDDPELVEASISATATAVRPVTRDGQQVWLVEGIGPRGSVDWVTEAGAGGRVVGLMEAIEEGAAEDEADEILRELLPDDEIAVVARARELHPDLYEALIEAADAEDAKDGGKDELAELIKKYLPRFKGNRKLAEKAAQRELRTAKEASADELEGGEEVNIAEMLKEALTTDEGRAAVADVLGPVVQERFDAIVVPRLGELVEAALEDERELMQAEANAISGRRLQVRDLRDAAHEQIKESKLPEAFQVELRKRYDLVSGAPTPALDVVEDYDEEGKVTKSAEEKLREALAADIATQRGLWEAADPTRVRGQGAAKAAPKTEGEGTEGTEGEEKGKAVEEAKKRSTTGSPLTDQILTEGKFDESELGDIYVTS